MKYNKIGNIYLSSVMLAFLAGTFYSNTSSAAILYGQQITMRPYLVEQKTSTYKLATLSNLTIAQLNNINRNQLKGRSFINAGETIYLPSDSSVFVNIPTPQIIEPIIPIPLEIETTNDASKVKLPDLGSNYQTLLASHSSGNKRFDASKLSMPNFFVSNDEDIAISPDGQVLQARAITEDISSQENQGLTQSDPNSEVGLLGVTNPSDLLNTEETEQLSRNSQRLDEDNENASDYQSSSRLATEILNDIALHFGTAQVSVTADEKFDISDAQVNILADLYENDAHFVFTQVGFNTQGEGKEQKHIANIGLGYRYDFETFRIGANTFVDNDFSSHSTRMSIGAEFFADYMNLSSNLYLPLSSWKVSDVQTDEQNLSFKERPAKGIDITANVYLPQYPQLGAGIQLAQYWGDSVGLLSPSQKQNNPMAISANVNYTPIPLVTMKTAHRFSDNGDNDTAFNLDMNLRLGQPLSEQLDSSKVAQMRMLKGSKRDIVDRNYSIVYEYISAANSITISGPTTATVDQVVNFNADISQDLVIQDATWIVQSPTSYQEYNSKDLSLTMSQEGDYMVQYAVKTIDNQLKYSNPLNVSVTQANSEIFELTYQKLSGFALVPGLRTQIDKKTSAIMQLKMNNTQSFNIYDTTVPTLEWRDEAGELCSSWCKVNNNDQFLMADFVPINNQIWEISINGFEAMIDRPVYFRVSTILDGKRHSILGNQKVIFY